MDIEYLAVIAPLKSDPAFVPCHSDPAICPSPLWGWNLHRAKTPVSPQDVKARLTLMSRKNCHFVLAAHVKVQLNDRTEKTERIDNVLMNGMNEWNDVFAVLFLI